jgi:hypothetical protein
MTESDWNRCTDPQKMLDFLRGNASERKLRLLACACCRRISYLLPDHEHGKAIKVNERYADGLATRKEMTSARQAAEDAFYERGGFEAGPADARSKAMAAWVVWAAVRQGRPPGRLRVSPSQAELWVGAAVRGAVRVAVKPGPSGVWEPEWKVQWDGKYTCQCNLLRDIFGPLPFHEFHADPAWLAWNNGTVKKLAEAAYEHRSLPEGTLEQARLAVLADALEEAGCTDADILGHLRGPGPHVRGCFAVDILLGKS